MTKKESSMLYGIAITMMLFLHLFATNTECYSFLNHLFRNSNILHHTAWFCKICVSIYAFISGYGLYKSNEKDVYIEVKQSIKNDFLFSMKHLLKLYKKYWIVFIIFVPLGFYIERFTNFSFHIFILSSLGMSSSYNGTWWYIKQYVIFVLIFPLINFIFKEGIKRSERISCCVITIISMGFLLEKNVLNKSNCAYCLIFLIGFITSKYMIIEKFRRIICEYSLVSRRIVIYFVIFLCICVRSAFTLKWGG